MSIDAAGSRRVGDHVHGRQGDDDTIRGGRVGCARIDAVLGPDAISDREGWVCPGGDRAAHLDVAELVGGIDDDEPASGRAVRFRNLTAQLFVEINRRSSSHEYQTALMAPRRRLLTRCRPPNIVIDGPAAPASGLIGCNVG